MRGNKVLLPRQPRGPACFRRRRAGEAGLLPAGSFRARGGGRGGTRPGAVTVTAACPVAASRGAVLLRGSPVPQVQASAGRCVGAKRSAASLPTLLACTSASGPGCGPSGQARGPCDLTRVVARAALKWACRKKGRVRSETAPSHDEGLPKRERAVQQQIGASTWGW